MRFQPRHWKFSGGMLTYLYLSPPVWGLGLLIWICPQPAGGYLNNSIRDLDISCYGLAALWHHMTKQQPQPQQPQTMHTATTNDIPTKTFDSVALIIENRTKPIAIQTKKTCFVEPCLNGLNSYLSIRI